MMQKSPTEYPGTMEQIPALTETDFASARSDAVGRIVGSAEEELDRSLEKKLREMNYGNSSQMEMRRVKPTSSVATDIKETPKMRTKLFTITPNTDQGLGTAYGISASATVSNSTS